MGILEKINGHDDLMQLDDAQLEALCQEIRSYLVESISKTGGHLASNLGVVELTVAIETVFDTARDRLVFDVGHQSYVHKLLTGRQADFARLRQFGGVAGFPKPCESGSDAFVAGHASSSVSIGLGMARARTLTHQNYHVITLLGDGAATGGMVYEGLNDAAESGEPMIILLNDNEMSIDRNVGGVAKHLSRLRSKDSYLGAKQKYRDLLARFPGGQFIYRTTRSVKDWVKRMVLPTTIFENMGLTYLGPVDGHDLPNLISLLRAAKEMKEPVLIHVLTHKGHGYAPAEQHPSKFHGIGKFDPVTGKTPPKAGKSFSDSFGETMCALARKNDRVCAITAAMPGGTGLMKFKEQFPKRTFDVGIAEEHAMSMAGGLAKQGMIPVIALYSTFLQRSYDMILQDLAMLGLHAVIAVDRAGLVGEDGETHHGVFDVGFLRQVPGMMLLAPGSIAEQQQMLEWAVEEHTGPVAIRYPRGGNGAFSGCVWETHADIAQNGIACCHRKGKDVTILTYGVLVNNALRAADILAEQGLEATVIRLLTLSPLPVADIVKNMAADAPVVIVEETMSGSGIRQDLAWALIHQKTGVRVEGIDLGGKYVTHGDMASLYRKHGLDGEGIAGFVKEVCSHEN